MFYKKYKEKFKNIENILKSMQETDYDSSILSLRDFITPPSFDQINLIDKNNFLLFSYESHLPKFNWTNLGDYIQTIATKNALKSIFSNINFLFHDRDTLTSYYQKDKITPVVMQGWFSHSRYFIPNNNTLPVFVGTHFASEIYNFIQRFISFYPWFFKDKQIGCRDFETLRFCQTMGLDSYLSRCLTLTLPKRDENIVGDTIYFVGISKDMLAYMPDKLKNSAEHINQQEASFEVDGSLDWKNLYRKTEDLLQTYKNKAKLIVTSALHCAAPCTAMGIPVVLIAKNQENINRFSAIKGIIPIYTYDDLKNNRINFNPKSLNIEDLKQYMLQNLKLSILKEMGEKIDENELTQIRHNIQYYKAY